MRDERIFVFGSNKRGAHGAGAALCAHREHGAVLGDGEGLTGRSYALPTKGWRLEVLPLEDIKVHVDRFLDFARSRPDLRFLVTRVGCGLAGYTDEDIAPLFADAPDNCDLPDGW